MADPASQTLISAVTIAAAALAYGALVWLMSRNATSDNFEVVNRLVIVAYAGVAACAVTVRARTVRRRTLALGTLSVGLVFPLVVLMSVGSTLDERFRSYFWLLNASYLVLTLSILAAWGVSRRHGAWWWLGLVPAAGLYQAQSLVSQWLIEALPPTVWGVLLTAFGVSMPILGGAVCWLIDVVTTHPRRAHRRGP